MGGQDGAQKLISDFTAQLEQEVAKQSGQANVERLTALHADVSGRMSKAFDGKDRFCRWGKHYLRALLRAHQLQVCTNSMDPGLQVYGGDLFKTIREEGDRIFVTLPPPKTPHPPPMPVPASRVSEEKPAESPRPSKTY